MPGSRAPVLQSIVPLGAVPERLSSAVARAIAKWGYVWNDVTFAGTAMLPAGTHWQLPGSEDVWVVAITAGPLVIGDQLESAGGRGVGVSVSAFSGGVIPLVPYQAQVYEFLGRRGGGQAPQRRPLRNSPTTARTRLLGVDPGGVSSPGPWPAHSRVLADPRMNSDIASERVLATRWLSTNRDCIFAPIARPRCARSFVSVERTDHPLHHIGRNNDGQTKTAEGSHARASRG